MKLILAGDSAGGNLALACSLLLLQPQYSLPGSRCFAVRSSLPLQADEHTLMSHAADCVRVASAAMQHAPPPSASTMQNGDSGPVGTIFSALLIFYPCLDPSRSGLSHVAHATSPTLAASELTWFWQQYVPGYSIDCHDTASPLYCLLNASDDVLRLLPPVFLATAGQDPLYDDGAALASRLKVNLCPLQTPSLPHSLFRCWESKCGSLTRSCSLPVTHTHLRTTLGTMHVHACHTQ